ncbi:MAG: phosphoenolpyruvate--protein phosphotransferase [Ignavibacteriae bacterium]|nr:MAG: phosphoenolpyruvate--protein phosphotransferase [Ignavibacteriota bacterium]
MEQSIKQEIKLKGIPASPGIATGPVFLFRKHEPIIPIRSIAADEVEPEIERLRNAVARSKKELTKVFEFAEQKLGTEQSKIFEAQLLILEDVVLFDVVYKRLKRERKNAEHILKDEMEKYHQLMMASKDEFARERADDLLDVQNRILRNLEEQKLISKIEGSHVIISHNLAAADTLIFSRNDVLAYVTELGGATSHMALLARALKIPAIVGIHQLSSLVQTEDQIVIDGYSGTVVLHPSPETLLFYEKKKTQHLAFEEALSTLRDFPAETLDGHRIKLAANVELEEEFEFIKMQGAEGIGLYRTESLLIGKEVFPSEEEQFEVYHHIAESVFPNHAIIRTFDIGGDKFMTQAMKENNPFLGWRGIRVMLDKPQIFLDQLRAILRASRLKNLALMLPMVTSIKEVQLSKQLIAQAKDDLRAQKIPFDENLRLGVMIEVPAAAVIADHLAREVSFLSIGTNDLIQYLLAVDRGNDIVSDLFQEFHPAVIRFLRRIIERGKQEHAWVGMCGQMAGDPLATILLVGLGLDEFSVVPTVLPEIKKIIRSIHFTEAQHVAERVLAMQSEDEIKAFLKHLMKHKFPDIPIG